MFVLVSTITDSPTPHMDTGQWITRFEAAFEACGTTFILILVSIDIGLYIGDIR